VLGYGISKFISSQNSSSAQIFHALPLAGVIHFSYFAGCRDSRRMSYETAAILNQNLA
jgi:hypothetical protein